MKRFFLLLSVLLSVRLGAVPSVQVAFPGGNSGSNAQSVELSVGVDDYGGPVFLAVGVTMPTKDVAPSFLIKNNVTINAPGIYQFNSGDTQDKGTGWVFNLDPKVLPVIAGGNLLVISGHVDNDGYIITDMASNSTSWVKYTYLIPDQNALGELPKINGPSMGVPDLSITDKTTLQYDADNMEIGDYFYCRIVPAGVPLNADRLPDITVTSAPRAEIDKDYTGSTFRVRYSTGELDDEDNVLTTNLLINPNLRERVQSYLDDGVSQQYQYTDGFILQIIAVNAHGVSSNQILYYSWDDEPNVYNAYIAQTATQGKFVSGGSVNYLVDYDASFIGSGFSGDGRVYIGFQSFASVTNVSGALPLIGNEYNINTNLIYYLPFTSGSDAKYNLAQLMLDTSVITLYVRASNSNTTLDSKSVERIYTFSSDVINTDVRRPNNFIGTGTLTALSGSTGLGYGWYIEQDGYLVNTIDVTKPFVVYLGTNYYSEGVSWDGDAVPRLLIHDIANDKWSQNNMIPASMSLKDNGATYPGLFANSNYNNYYTITVNDYYQLMGIDPENYISGGNLEIKIGSANNTPEITRPGTAVNTFAIYGNNVSRVDLDTELSPGNNSGISIFSGMAENPSVPAPADVLFKVTPSYIRKSGIQENSRTYFVLGDNGVIDLNHAIEYNLSLTLEEGITYYTAKTQTVVNFDAFLTENSSELTVRTRSVAGNYQEAIKIWTYVRKLPILNEETWTLDLYYNQHDIIDKNLEDMLIDLGYLNRDNSSRSSEGLTPLVYDDIDSFYGGNINNPVTAFDWYMIDPYATKALNQNGITNGTSRDYAMGTITGTSDYAYYQSRYQVAHKPWINTKMLYKNYVGWNGKELVHTYYVMQSGGHTYRESGFNVSDLARNNIKDALPGNANTNAYRYLTVNVHVIPKEEPDFQWRELAKEDYSNPGNATPSYYEENDIFNKPYPIGSGVTNYGWASQFADQDNPAKFGLADDNYYVIIRSMKDENGNNMNTYLGYGNLDWNFDLKAPDYDSNTNVYDYFNFINASSKENGLFYSTEVDICTDIPLRFKAQFSNLTTGLRNGGYGGNYRIKPNIYVRILSGQVPDEDRQLSNSDLLLKSYSFNPILGENWTGDVEMTREWEDMDIDFYPKKEDGNSILVQFMTVELGGLGNDFAIDNIQILAQELGVYLTKGFVECQATTTDPENDDVNNGYDLVLSFNDADMEALYYQSGISESKLKYWYYLVPPNAAADEGFVSYTSYTYDFDADNPDENNVILKDVNGDRLTLSDGQYVVYIYFSENETPPTIDDFLSNSCFPYASFTNKEMLIEIVPDVEIEGSVCPGEQITLTVEGFQSGEEGMLEWFYYNNDGSMYSMHNFESSITVYPARTTTYGVHIAGCPSSVKTFTIEVKDLPYVNFGSKDYVAGQQEIYTYRTCYTEENLTELIIPLQGASYGLEFKITDTDGNVPDYLDSFTVGAVDGVSGSTLGLTLNFKSLPFTYDEFVAKDSGEPKNMISLVISPAEDSEDVCDMEKTFNIRYIAPRSVWVGPEGVESATKNWNVDEYWKAFDYVASDDAGNITIYENSVAGVPMVCTDVIIPGGNGYPYAGYYPDLELAMNTRLIWDDGFYVNPVCNTITFEMGGELDKQYLLRYHKAFVEFNFGQFSGGSLVNPKLSSQMFSRERYYLISAPLQDMYTGDLFFGGKPNVYARYSEIQPVANDDYDPYEQFVDYGKFLISNSLPTFNIPLSLGFGFAYGVLGNTYQQPDTDALDQGLVGVLGNINPGNANQAVYDQTNIGKKEGIVKYPRFEEEKWGPQVSASLQNGYPKAATGESYGFNQYESFLANASGEGSSAFRYFYLGQPDKVVTDSRAFEVASRGTFVTPDYGSGEKTVFKGNRFIISQSGQRTISSTDIQSNGQGGYYDIIIGNPYMAHLDFGKFYKENNVQPYYRIFDGEHVYETLYDANGFVSTTDPVVVAAMTEGNGSPLGTDLLSPMQAFFITPLAGSDLVLKYDATMTSAPDRSPDVSSGSYFLRSSQVKNDRCPLLIKVSNGRESGTASVVRYSKIPKKANGVPKMFTGSLSSPEVFVNQKGDFKSIVQIDESETSVPFGIINRSDDTRMTIQVDGIRNIPDDIEVGIYDSMTGETTVLTGNENIYSFNSETKDGSLLNRFFLVFNDEGKIPTSVDQVDKDIISIYVLDKMLYVNSVPNDLVQTIRIYGIQGQPVASYENLSQANCQFRVDYSPGIYVVEVRAGKEMKVEKFIIR